ncbi:MAG: CHASE2 domain-containing protein [Bacteroidetes bacterium]|nr:CHASE2 domain-containing protein [Bacteroidota bacterium]
MRKLLLRPDNFFATLFIFISTALLGLIIINISPLDPFESAFKDFQYSDILYSKIRSRQNLLDTNIVLISIDTLKRESIAQELKNINKFSPKVVGLDIIFEQLKDPVSDSLLKIILAQTPHLVMADYAKENEKGEIEKLQTSNPYFGEYPAGHVNLSGADPETTTIRTFQPLLYLNGKEIPSFSAEILRLYNPYASSKLLSYKDKQVIINYIGNYNSFLHFSSNDVLNNGPNLTRIRDKIVLIGNFYPDSLNLSLEDKFFTPLNKEISGRSWPDMHGMVIHANIISMVLKDNFIYVIPAWVGILIAFLICYLHIAFFLYFYVEKHKWFQPLVKAIQLFTIVLIMYLVFLLYEHWNIRYDSTLLIVILILSVDLLYFYEGLIKILNKWFGIKSYLLSKHN